MSITHPVHEVFVKEDPHSLLGNVLEKSRLPQAPPIHSEDEREGEQPCPDRSRKYSEESELSSVDQDFVSYGDSTGPLQTSKRERFQNSLSPSPYSAEEDQAGRSDAPKKRAPVQPSEKSGWDAPEKRGPAKPQVVNAKSKVIIENPDLETHNDEDSGSSTEFDDDDDDDYSDHGARRRLRDLHSGNKYKWTTEQDRILWETMLREMQSAGVEHMSVPLPVKKELAQSFGRKQKAISRRWLLLSGRGTWNGLDKTNAGPVLAKSALQEEKRAPASCSRPLNPEIPRQSEGAVASEPQDEIGSTRDYHASTWSPQEIEILTTLTRGLHRSADIDFKHIAAQMPDPSRRTVDACRRFWERRVRPSQGTPRILRPPFISDKGTVRGHSSPAGAMSTYFQWVMRQILSHHRQRPDTWQSSVEETHTLGQHLWLSQNFQKGQEDQENLGEHSCPV